jgi:hypothetical protein
MFIGTKTFNFPVRIGEISIFDSKSNKALFGYGADQGHRLGQFLGQRGYLAFVFPFDQ